MKSMDHPDAVDGLGRAPDSRWIQTYTGRAFWPLSPRVEDVDIEDIAHALSMKCRYTGHSRHFYCVTPATRVLTLDMRWLPAGELALGQPLLGFDEHVPVAVGGRAGRRRLRASTVLHTGIIHRECYRLTLSDGTELVSSAEHPWLTTAKLSRNQKWETTERIAGAINGTHKSRGRLRKGRRYMLRFLRPWEPATGYDAGYVAGLLDGEGHVTFRPSSSHGGMSTGFAQRPGAVMDTFARGLHQGGFDFDSRKNPQSSVHNVTVRGGWQEQFRLLGTYRPQRLLAKLVERLAAALCRYEFPSVDALEVVRAEQVGVRDVVALETSSRTYFAEGFGAHNSVAQHAYIASKIVPPGDEKWGLMHDAAEAYLPDVARPVKKELSGFKEIEHRLERAIAERFGLEWPMPTSIATADLILLATERRDLMSRPPYRWTSTEKVDPLLITIHAMSPSVAKETFLMRFEELFGADARS